MNYRRSIRSIHCDWCDSTIDKSQAIQFIYQRADIRLCSSSCLDKIKHMMGVKPGGYYDKNGTGYKR